MKSRFWIFVSALVAIIFVLMFLLLQRPVSDKKEQDQDAVLTTNTPNSTAGSENGTSSTPSSKAVPATSPWTAAKNDPEKKQQMFRDYVEEQNVPINFYGKVINQNSNGLSGVRVKVKVRQWQMVPPMGSKGQMIPVEKETGPDGQFEISGLKGDGFDIESIQKEGYELSPKTYRTLGSVGGSPSNPVIYRMWKTGIKEPLIAGQKVFGIASDGRVYTLDLLQGKKLEGSATEGDLRISITRPLDAKPRNKYPWAFEIEGVQGGLFETDDEFMYLAPESGYEAKFQMQLAPTDSSWTSLVKKQFFIRSRNGQVYGRIQVEVNAVYNEHSAIEVNYAVNPAGSRNLQP